MSWIVFSIETVQSTFIVIVIKYYREVTVNMFSDLVLDRTKTISNNKDIALMMGRCTYKSLDPDEGMGYIYKTLSSR